MAGAWNIFRLPGNVSMSGIVYRAKDPIRVSPPYQQGPAGHCGHDSLCVAKKGYDAPTGLGSPDGIGAF